MSDKNDISRRKALAATAGLGSLTVVPGVAAGRGGSDGPELSDEERARNLRQSLAESEHVVADSEQYRQFTAGELEPLTRGGEFREEFLPDSTAPDDVAIYSGKYKNAQPPSGTHFAIETPAEWRQRSVPVALEGALRPEFDYFYVETDIGCVSPSGYDICVGFGVGVILDISSDGTANATLSADIFLDTPGGSLTISPASFSVGVGPGEHEGYCLGPLGADSGYVPGLEVEVCGSISTFGGFPPSGIEISATPEVCVDACPGVSCPVCTSPGSVSLQVPP